MGWGFGETIGFVGWRIYFINIRYDVFKPSIGFMMFLLQGGAGGCAAPCTPRWVDWRNLRFRLEKLRFSNLISGNE